MKLKKKIVKGGISKKYFEKKYGFILTSKRLPKGKFELTYDPEIKIKGLK